jgi:hypothetical protein
MLRIFVPKGAVVMNERNTPLNSEAITWAFRLFIGREPRSAEEIEFHATHPSLESLRIAFSETLEFQAFLRSISAKKPYCAPLFLLSTPSNIKIPFVFSEPSLKLPTTQLCTSGQVSGAQFEYWCQALDIIPHPHRKIWEFCYIAAVMEACDLLRPNCRALGFGVGREPLPALLAARGVHVVATDAPEDVVEGQGWVSTGQHAASIGALERPNIINREKFREFVKFRSVDMNSIPGDLREFDVCWSSCALEHLGSIEHGLRFVKNSLATLRPGGIAVHTTEFNLSSNDNTFESPDLSLFRRQDIERLFSHLIEDGHEVFPVNFHPGAEPLDTYIDLPPYALPHLKIEAGHFITTSIGLAVRKRA